MEKVLIVDDDITFNLMLKSFLEKNDLDVTQAASGKKALGAVDQATFDAVLVDLSLPDDNGIDLLKKIKKSLPKAILLLMTSDADTQTAEETIKADAHDYITK